MAGRRIDALTPRHRECLRRVRRLQTTKEIAADLGLSPSTVDGYIAEAIRLLEARDRRDAARILAENERVAPPPEQLGGENLRVEPPAVPEASEVPPTPSRRWLPLRRKGERYNDLTIAQRLAFIPLIALAGMIAFGMLANGLAVLVNVFAAFGIKLK